MDIITNNGYQEAINSSLSFTLKIPNSVGIL